MGDPDKGAFLDAHLSPCPDGTSRVGGDPTAAGVPWPELPGLAPPPGLHVGATDRDVFPPRPKPGSHVARWCRGPDGTPEGPAVFSTADGAWRIFAQHREGTLEGPLQGESWILDDDGTPLARNEIELDGNLTGGRPDGAWSTECPLQDMNARCPGGARVEGQLEEGRRVGRWTWYDFDGAASATVTVDYAEGVPQGTARHDVLHPFQGMDCTDQGAVDEAGRQGRWVRTCTTEGEAPVRTEVRWRDGVVQD